MFDLYTCFLLYIIKVTDNFLRKEGGKQEKFMKC